MHADTKPLIGVVADLNRKPRHAVHSVGDKYLDAVTAGAGAIAFILPALIDRPDAAFTDPRDVETALDNLDGLFLTGATSNVDPGHYGATLADPESPADPARDHVSLALVRAAIRRGMPVLGVCRGFQEINVALGGTLHQQVHNVPGLADHRERDEDPLEQQYGVSHPVALTPGGLLQRLAGAPTAEVNSLHGQGVDRLAPGLAVEARAPDGLVEAYRGEAGGFLVAVQWHPEWRFRENPLSVQLFRAFGDAARAWRARRGSAGMAA
ncbi:MAG: gamma-glutamyl-gamma-aminobutyrate hydrolase family protein [Rhodospirillales bacterium]